MPVRFGVHTGLQYVSIADLRAAWRRIEDAGYDWISIWDHFYAADLTGGAECLEAVATHSVLAVDTERVRCGSLVYSIGYRHPAVIANAIATIDRLSGGRVTLGMGAGWCEPEYRAHGIPFPEARVRLAQLEEGVQCVRRLLDGESVDFAGEHFTLDEARCEPAPVQHPFPVWVGGGGEQVTLRIVARHAEGWNAPFVSPEGYARKAEVLERHCEDVGRDPASIDKAVNLPLAWTGEGLEERFGALLPVVEPSVLSGSTQQVVDRVGEYVEGGVDWVIVAARAPFDLEGLERFASEVIPELS